MGLFLITVFIAVNHRLNLWLITCNETPTFQTNIFYAFINRIRLRAYIRLFRVIRFRIDVKRNIRNTICACR